MNRHINFHGKVKRFNHNLSYRNFFSGEIGELRPVWLEDAVPGDTFQYTPELRLYFAPLLFPVLSSIKCRVDTFFVPNRLAWSEWESFITAGPDNNLSPAYPSVRHLYSAMSSSQKSNFAPWFGNGAANVNSIFNNLGLPSNAAILSGNPYDMIPYYDYLFIYDEYYRDEEKEPISVTGYGGIHRDVYDVFTDNNTLSLIVGNTNAGLYSVAWAKDYFTTASLEQQRGGDIPILTNPMFRATNGDLFDPIYSSASIGQYNSGSSTVPTIGISTVNKDNQRVELESVLSVNGLRYLYAAANWLNNNVIGGTRYIEQLRTRYRVVSSDARLQRPEMVGSSYINVNIDVVTQTSSTVEDSDTIQALGDRAGKGSVIGRGKTLTYSAEEFGYFISILHIAPKAAYFQGIRRNLQREDKFDFWTPEFEHLPQQEIRNNELFVNSTTLPPESGGTFGYTGRFNEYRHHNDEVHGDFTDTLLAWTMARKFSSLPAVNSLTFLKVDHAATGNNRIFADPSSEFAHLFGVLNNIVLAKREISNREPRF